MPAAFVPSDRGPDGARGRVRLDGLALNQAVVDEVFAQASEEQAVNFFVAVGRRLAGTLVLPDDDRLLSLEQATNGVWQRLGLGHAAWTVNDEGILISHADYAGNGPVSSSTWPKAAAAVVLGAYASWFEALGDGELLHTRLVQQTSDRIVIHHGL